MTPWTEIIQTAAYTRFCKTGSLEPFQLARRDLVDLMRQVSGWPRTALDEQELGRQDILRIQVQVPVTTIGDGLVICVDEWHAPPGPARGSIAP